ncbi:MAG: hypothetical protein Q8N54_16200, partial [Sulfurimicrobium sp.]|nr:hypothetical protein [Sulfurimicrobium sp.]
MPSTPPNLSNLIASCMQRDRHRLTRQLQRLQSAGKKDEVEWIRLQSRISASAQFRLQRLENIPVPEFSADLPVNEKRADIAKAIDAHQVIIVCGETGSGKTTQLPQICLDLKRGVSGL